MKKNRKATFLSSENPMVLFHGYRSNYNNYLSVCFLTWRLVLNVCTVNKKKKKMKSWVVFLFSLSLLLKQNKTKNNEKLKLNKQIEVLTFNASHWVLCNVEQPCRRLNSDDLAPNEKSTSKMVFDFLMKCIKHY